MIDTMGLILTINNDCDMGELTSLRSVAAIPFGGRYRLIDFVLSNLVNSGIINVGVATDYNYQSLMDHVGSGKDWDLARKDGGVIILPPFGDLASSTLYNTRLEALKGITNFLFRADEEYVVMTDCDAICRLDYNDILEYHIRNRADITLVYKNRTAEAGEDKETTFDLTGNRITGVSYKAKLDDVTPANVFMNVFVLKRALLQNIVMDSISHNKNHFVADVVSANLNALNIIGYEHKGYYAGIKSLLAYYDSNLALLKPEVKH